MIEEKGVVLGKSFTLGQSILASEPLWYISLILWVASGVGLVFWRRYLNKRKKQLGRDSTAPKEKT